MSDPYDGITPVADLDGHRYCPHIEEWYAIDGEDQCDECVFNANIKDAKNWLKMRADIYGEAPNYLDKVIEFQGRAIDSLISAVERLSKIKI